MPILGIILFSCAAQNGATPVQPVPPPMLLKSFGSAEGNYRGSPVVADINLDGVPEIVTTAWGEVLVHTPAGKPLLSLKVQGRVYSGAILGDLDGDRRREILAADNQGKIHAWRADGTSVPGWPQEVRLKADVRSMAAADLDGDGKDEVVVFSSLTDHGCEPNMYVFQGDGTVRKGWPHFFPGDPHLGQGFDHAGGFNHCLAVGDVDGDNRPDLVFCQDYGSMCLFRTDGTPFAAAGQAGMKWWHECRAWYPQPAEKVKWGPEAKNLLEFTYSPPLIADLDLDGRPEILAVPNMEEKSKVGPIVGSCLVVRNADFTPKAGFSPWKISDVGGGPRGDYEANPAVVAGDITRDARLEVVVTHLDGTLRAYGADGADLWSVKLGAPSSILCEPLLADLDGDSKAEVIVTVTESAEKSGRLVVVDGAGRTRLEFPLPFHNQAAPTLADVTGDGVPELVVAAFQRGTGPHTVFVYAWPCVRGVQWGTGRGDFGHTACVRKPRRPAPAAAPAPAEKPAAPPIAAEALEPWNRKLVERVARGLREGQRPLVSLRTLGTVRVVGSDGKRLRVEIDGGAGDLPWEAALRTDRLRLALAFLKERVAEDHLLAAVFALAEGRMEAAQEQFERVRAADPGGGELEARARESLGLKP
jgi:hypothetical protein